MNKTHHLLIPLFGLLLAMGCLTGCIKEDMSDCPPPVNPEPEPDPTTGTLKLALTYFMHNTQENGEYVDLFSQQVRKVDVFVFDEEGNYLQQITEEAAPQFADNYTKVRSVGQPLRRRNHAQPRRWRFAGRWTHGTALCIERRDRTPDVDRFIVPWHDGTARYCSERRRPSDSYRLDEKPKRCAPRGALA